MHVEEPQRAKLRSSPASALVHVCWVSHSSVEVALYFSNACGATAGYNPTDALANRALATAQSVSPKNMSLRDLDVLRFISLSSWLVTAAVSDAGGGFVLKTA
jgi:hypothetical protein